MGMYDYYDDIYNLGEVSSRTQRSIKMEKVTTPEFRLSYPYLFEASRGPKGDQQPKFRIVMLFPKSTDISALKQLAKDAANDFFSGKVPKGIRLPWRDGDEEKSDQDGYKGHWFISASSKMRPGLVNQDLQPIISQDELYAGCYCRATLVAFGYDVSGNKGVAFGLQNLQKLRDGEPFSGRTKAEDDFDAVSSGNDSEPAQAGASGANNDDMFE